MSTFLTTCASGMYPPRRLSSTYRSPVRQGRAGRRQGKASMGEEGGVPSRVEVRGRPLGDACMARGFARQPGAGLCLLFIASSCAPQRPLTPGGILLHKVDAVGILECGIQAHDVGVQQGGVDLNLT